MIKLKTFLKDRLQQLITRQNSIEYYLKNKTKSLGSIHYDKEDLKITQNRIEETKAALAGIVQWEKGIIEF